MIVIKAFDHTANGVTVNFPKVTLPPCELHITERSLKWLIEAQEKQLVLNEPKGLCMFGVQVWNDYWDAICEKLQLDQLNQGYLPHIFQISRLANTGWKNQWTNLRIAILNKLLKNLREE